jgi:hypothetical protein
MTEQDAEKYRQLQAVAVIELFRRAHERAPTTLKELAAWVATAKIPTPVNPFDVLTPDQILQALTEIQ